MLVIRGIYDHHISSVVGGQEALCVASRWFVSILILINFSFNFYIQIPFDLPYLAGEVHHPDATSEALERQLMWWYSFEALPCRSWACQFLFFKTGELPVLSWIAEWMHSWSAADNEMPSITEICTGLCILWLRDLRLLCKSFSEKSYTVWGLKWNPIVASACYGWEKKTTLSLGPSIHGPGYLASQRQI